jgi:serine/threonine protein phosphatase PrpC
MGSTSYDWNQCLEYAALTDVGMRRANNQDSLNVALAGDVEGWYRHGHMFLVADGMGAHAAGELASRLAVDAIPHLYQKYGDKSAPEALQKAVFEANAEVHRRGQANAEFHNMGTTCETLVLLPQGVLLAHIGDSRIYRLRGEKLHQLTFDHSLLWEMRAAGQVEENSDLEAAIPKNVITRSLGPNSKVKVDIEGPYPVAVGDTFLLCSDGLTGKVKDEELGPILANLPPGEAGQVLIDLANLRGGPDNITTVVVKITGPEITTKVARAEPLTVGSMENEPTTVHPALWVVTGVCFLAALIMAALSQPLPALLAAIGGAIALTIGLLQLFGTFASTGVALTGGRRLGRGPYVEVSCAAGQDMVDNLADLAGELRDAAEGQQSPDEIDPFEQHCQRASAAAEGDDFAAAVKEYSQAISLMMRLLRETRDSAKPSDSSIDL